MSDERDKFEENTKPEETKAPGSAEEGSDRENREKGSGLNNGEVAGVDSGQPPDKQTTQELPTEPTQAGEKLTESPQNANAQAPESTKEGSDREKESGLNNGEVAGVDSGQPPDKQTTQELQTEPTQAGDQRTESLPEQSAKAPSQPASEKRPAPPPKPEPPKAIRIVGVKFKRAGKTYFFNAGYLLFSISEQIIVETDRGLGLCRVVTPVHEVKSEQLPRNLKRVIRKANWNDLERDRKNKELEKEAERLCAGKIKSRNLSMKLVRIEYLHDASKAIFYFTAEQRVDFRDLVKDLARELHTRIEMRQIGVRDESKITGGIGPCGREVCCCSFLTDFAPVSVKMAKDQNLAMNPSKVSGLCGRLMCCLGYEHPLYRELIKKMPRKGKNMQCGTGACRVIDLNILNQKVLVELESGKTMFLPVEELHPPGQAPPPPVDTSDRKEKVQERDRPRGRERDRPRGQEKDRSRGRERTGPGGDRSPPPRPAPGRSTRSEESKPRAQASSPGQPAKDSRRSSRSMPPPPPGSHPYEKKPKEGRGPQGPASTTKQAHPSRPENKGQQPAPAPSQEKPKKRHRRRRRNR